MFVVPLVTAAHDVPGRWWYGRSDGVELHDAESLTDGAMMLGGSLGNDGFVARLDAAGLASPRRLGRFVTDLAPSPDGEVFAVGWDNDGPALWRLDPNGDTREHAALPTSGVSVDPYRVLPGPIVIGTHNPITSGVLDGWIARRDGEAWREEIRPGGGYSGFLDAAATEAGFVVVGMGSRSATYQGWIAVERAGEWREQHVGGSHQILHTVAALPTGGFVVAGIGRAAKLDDALAVVSEVSWPAAGVFAYAPSIVDGEVAWWMTRHGRLRNRYTSVEVLRLPLGERLAAPEVVRVHAGATGGRARPPPRRLGLERRLEHAGHGHPRAALTVSADERDGGRAATPTSRVPSRQLVRANCDEIEPPWFPRSEIERPRVRRGIRPSTQHVTTSMVGCIVVARWPKADSPNCTSRPTSRRTARSRAPTA